MKIQCLFVIRDEARGPELLEAWDEYAIDENVEGWNEACTIAIGALKGEYLRRAYIDIDVSESDLKQRILGIATICGTVA